MKKLLYFLLVIFFLTACGSGGGGTGNGKGALTIAINSVQKSTPKVFPDPEPQFVRVVVKKKDTPSFQKIQDVELGSAPVSFSLEEATDYTVDAISYAKTGVLNRMIRHGYAYDDTDGLNNGIAVIAGVDTSVALTISDIDPVITLPAETFYAGSTFTTPSLTGIVGTPLRSEWYLALKMTDFTTWPHIPIDMNPSDYSVAPVMPSASTPGFVYAQGEFFINPLFLKASESSRSWVINSSTVEAPLLVHGLGIGADFFADTYPPHVRSLSAPDVVHTLGAVTVTVNASDNVGVAGYIILESTDPSNPPAAPTAGTGDWHALRTFTYDIQALLSAGDSVTLYAWAKDNSGNVSLEPAIKTVTYDNAPQLLSITLPTGVQLNPAIPYVIEAVGYAAPNGLASYYVTADPNAVAPAAGSGSWLPWPVPATAGVSSSSTSLTYDVPAINVSVAKKNITLYAWVSDANGISKRASASFSISTKPQVTNFKVGIPAAGSTVVSVTGFAYAAYLGSTVVNYLISEDGDFTPSASSAWQPLPVALPFNYNYAGTLVYVDDDGLGGKPPYVKKPLYAWVRDNSGVISERKSVVVNFTQQ